ncbi:MAG: CHAP domain-containing protein [Candidatus Baltobacteraceae bacterium]
MRYLRFVAVVAIAMLAACSSGQPPPLVSSALSSQNTRSANGIQSQTFTLDNVLLVFQSRLPVSPFSASPAGASSQMAWSLQRSPMRMVDVEAIPYGFGSPLERTLQSVPGIAGAQRQALAARHASEQHVIQSDVVATMFGQAVHGTAYVDADPHANAGFRGTAHFVAEAGSRLWQINISQELSAAGAAAFAASLRDIALNSPSVNRPTTMAHDDLPSRAASRMESPPQSIATDAAAGLRSRMAYTGWYITNPPGWWTQQPNTPCDYEHYWLNTPSTVPAAFQLYSGQAGVNNPWHGLVACGPNPYKYANADVLEQFYSGAWGEYEWECVELSMRWMWEAYGVQPYSANGNTIASNYRSTDGGNVEYIANGGYPPLPVMGDVLQYSGGTYGHTSVVVSESHNSSGTGSLTVIEQNNGNYAGNSLTETNWYVNCASDGSGCPTAWLHRP